MKLSALPLLVMILMTSKTSLATPAYVVIIRHGEKPPQGNQLNAQGCERAYSLPAFFLSKAVVQKVGQPEAIYAQAPDSGTGSLRPVQTISPTAYAFGLPVDDQFIHDKYKDMVKEIMVEKSYDGKTIFISWEHTAIPALAAAFGAEVPADLQTWPDAVFDVAWILTFERREKFNAGKKNPNPNTVALDVIPESALPSDTPAGPQLSSKIVADCTDNNVLNQLARKVTSPPIPESNF